MAHTALARRYRPHRFSEVATQEHVSETLRRAVAGNRVGHAYLFCGPRGVGKTTLARVLAMALNCPNREEDGEPCGKCTSCSRIWAGTTALDVVEIDAASNRGVDDARELRSRAMYAPSEADRYKVYIVDEAHMLTREAWNALLKVLEEPPERVVFVFATTEPEKIEQTAAPILSRCQRFDFRRIGVAEIVRRLGEVLEREGAGAPEEALRLVARKADGGMRDALSLADQVLALSDGRALTLDGVRRLLGVVEEERYLETLDLLADRDRAGIFRLIEELLDEGHDLVEFYHGLVEAFRTVLRLQLGAPVPELPPERQEEWRARAVGVSAGDLVRMLGMAADLESGGSLRRSAQPRVLVELLLLRLSYLDRTLELEELLGAVGGERPPPDEGPRRPRSSPTNADDRPGSGLRRGAVASASGGAAPGGVAAERPPEPASAEHDRSPPGEADPDGPAKGAAATQESAPTVPPDLLGGWRAYLQSGEGIPPGLTPLLRGARASVTGPATLEVSLPAGLALDRLRDPDEVAVLERGLARHTGGTPRIQLREVAETTHPAAERVSQREVREGRLGDLLAKEPGLRGAVEGWDLEIVD